MFGLPRVRALLAIVGLALGGLSNAGARIVYVNAGSTASAPDGKSWATAYSDLTVALADANGTSTAANPVSLYLTAGTYTPDDDVIDPQSATFSLHSGIQIYGGFDPVSPQSDPGQISQFAANSLLSGEISYHSTQTEAFSPPLTLAAATGFALPSPSDLGFMDNARNVVTLMNATAVTLQNITISGGYAAPNGFTPLTDGQIQAMSFPTSIGPGDPASGTSQMVSPVAAGGGIYVQEVAPSVVAQGDLTLINCIIAGNYAQGYGGGIAALRSVVTCYGVIFAGNGAGVDGGSFWGRAGNADFSACQFLNSHADDSGGAVDFESPAVLPPNYAGSTAALYLSTDEQALRGIVDAVEMAYKMAKGLSSDAPSTFNSILKAVAGIEEQDVAVGEAELGAIDALGDAYLAVTLFDQTANSTVLLLQHFGVSDPFLNYWADTFQPNFNKYATPTGWAQDIYGAFEATLAPTEPEIRYGYTTLENQDEANFFANCTFSGNTANADGGAIFAARDNLRIEGGIFTANTSAGSGGALAATAFNQVMVFSTVFSANTAAGYSAVSCATSSSLRLINCSIVNNVSTGLGCAVGCTLGGQLRVYNSVLWANSNADPSNATGGADVYTATKGTLSPSGVTLYNQNANTKFTYVGTTEIGSCDIQSLNALTDGWTSADVQYLGGTPTTSAEITAFATVAATVDADGTQDFYQFQVFGEGVRSVSRSNISVDPKLFNGWYPGIGSPLIGAASINRESNAALAPQIDLDVLGQPRGGIYYDQPLPAGAQPTPLSIGAVQVAQAPVSATGAAPGRIFVAAVAAGDQSGSDWANATGDLKTALAQDHSEVWVQQGTYYPSATGDQTQSFVLGVGTIAYGGFFGTETALASRPLGTFATILSGNLSAVPGQTGATSSYHVVAGSNQTAATTLDGFTITGGVASGPGSTDQVGAGIFQHSAPIIVRNVTFLNNVALREGGGMYCDNATSTIVTNCVFNGNSAGANYYAGGASAGGGIFVQGSLNADRCLFTGNVGFYDGAAVEVTPYLNSDTASLFNSVITGNSSDNGSAISILVTANTVQNCTICDNTVTQVVDFGSGIGGGFIAQVSTLQSSILYNNNDLGESAGLAESAEIVVDGSPPPLLVVSNNVIQNLDWLYSGSGNIDPGQTLLGFANEAGGDYHLTNGSALIDAGGGTVYSAHPLDLDGNPRLVGAAVDIGAYEYTGVGTAVAGQITIARTFPGSDPVYSLIFSPARPLGGQPTYAWTVNMGNGFVALPGFVSPTAISGNGSPVLQITAPPANWNNWVFRVIAMGTSSSQAAAVLTGIDRNRLYVNSGATGNGSGLSWANAYTDLGVALNQAGDYAEIWVKRGVYHPATSSNPTGSYELRNGSVVYGGFAGTETALSQRQPTPGDTVLDGSYGTPARGNNTTNTVIECVTFTTDDQSIPTRLDGFTVTNSSNVSVATLNGGGKLLINQCVINSPFGTGLRMQGGVAKVTNSTITNCANGGVAAAATVTLQNCVLAKNTGPQGAGLSVESGTASLTQCTIADNTAAESAGGVFAQAAGGLALNQCILWGNRDGESSGLEAEQINGAYPQNLGVVTVTHSIVEGLSSYAGNGNIYQDPLFTSPTTGNFSVLPQSPAIALQAGIPFTGVPAATALHFVTLPESSTVLVNLPSQAFVADWDPSAESYTLSWQVNLGQGWISAPAAGLTATTSNGSGSSTFTLSTAAASLPSLLVRAVNSDGTTLTPAQLQVLPPVIWRVNVAAAGQVEDGLSWATAFHSISHALTAAQPGAGTSYQLLTGIEIWVAKGTYTETGTPPDPDSPNLDTGAMQLFPNVVLYGGFLGSESARSQRVLSASTLTTVNGSFQSGVTYPGLGNQPVLDGFTVIGLANGSQGLLPAISLNGGGNFSNCIFSNPHGTAALLDQGGYVFTNCSFLNAAQSGLVASNNAAVRLIGCTVSGNSGGSAGQAGGISARDSDIYAAGCTFTGNVGADAAGAIGLASDGLPLAHTLTVISSTLTGNRGLNGSAIEVEQEHFVARNVTIANNLENDVGAVYLVGSTADVANCILWGNQGSNDPAILAGYGLPGTGNSTIEALQIFADSATTITVGESVVQGLTLYRSASNSQYDPLFANTGSLPFALTAASPAIGLGSLALLQAVTNASADPARTAGTIDAGAYEFTGVPASAKLDLLAAPGSVTIFSGALTTFTLSNPALNPVTWQEFVGGNWVAVTGPEWSAASSGGVSTLTLLNPSAADAGTYRAVVGSIGGQVPSFTIAVTNRQIVYVNAAANSGGNGSTWSSAFQNLEGAYGAASSDLEIRVAAGSYGASQVLQLRPGFLIRGGFPADGSITDPAQRNLGASPTIISAQFFADGSTGTVDGSAGFDGVIFTPPAANLASPQPQLYLTSGVSPALVNCGFQNAGELASGVWVDPESSAQFVNCQFLNNQATVITCQGSIQMSGCTFSGNQGGNSGPTVSCSGALEISNSTFSQNGGGSDFDLIGLSNPFGLAPTVTLSHDIFTANSAGLLSAEAGTVNIDDTLFARNSGFALLLVDQAVLTLTQCTLVDNIMSGTAVSGSDSAVVTISNSILWGARNPGSSSLSIYQQQIEANGQIVNSIVEGAPLTPGAAVIGADPLFVNQQSGNYTLSPHSPAVGTGSKSASTAVDLAGITRGSSVDLGAYAFTGTAQPPLFLTKLPAPSPVYVNNNATFTVAVPSGLAVQWWYWNGSATVPLPTNPRFVVTATATSSTLSVTDVLSSDAGNIVFTVSGSSYVSPLYSLGALPRLVRYLNPAAPNGGDGLSWGTAWNDPIQAFNAAPDGAQIWVATGQYYWSPGQTLQTQVHLLTGVEIYGGFTVGAISLSQRNPSPAVTVFHGDFNNDAQFNSVDETAVLDDITLNSVDRSPVLWNTGTNPTLNNCVIQGCYQAVVISSGGGGTFSNCVFTGNASLDLEIDDGTVTVTNSQFHSNQNLGLNAGSIYLSAGSLNVSGCSFFNYSLGDQTLIEAAGGTLVIDRTQIDHNTAVAMVFAGQGSQVTVRDSLVQNNSVELGTIYVEGTADVTESTVYGNTASGPASAAGVGVSGASLALHNSILWHNRSLSAEGETIENQQAASSGGTLTATSNIIEGYAALGGTGNLPDDPLFTDAADGVFTLQSDSPAINSGDATLSETGFPLDLAGNPRVAGSAPDRGAYEFQGVPAPVFAIVNTPVSTYAVPGGTAQFSITLASGSATWQLQTAPGVFGSLPTGGNYTVAVVGGTSTLTVSGLTAANNGQQFRVLSSAGSVSDPVTLTVGPPRIIYVNGAAQGTATGTSWANAFTSVTDAIGNWTSGGQIWIANGTYAIEFSVAMPDGMQIYGGFAGNETLLTQRGGNTGTVFVGSPSFYYIDESSTPSVTVRTVIDGIEFKGGTGGINSTHASLTINNCVFIGFTGREAIVDSQSASVISHCLFSANLAGAIYEGQSSSTISGCTFSDNSRITTVTGGVGSALCLAAGGSSPGTTTVTASTFERDGNAAVSVAQANATFDGCTWSGCAAPASAVLAAATGTTVRISNSLIAQNSTTASDGVITSAGSLTLQGVTFANNTNVPWNGNVGVIENTGSLTILNSILWGNRTTGALESFTVEQNQIYSPAAPAITYTIVEGLNVYAGTGNSGFDPLFDLASTTGFSLSGSSPAVDAGFTTPQLAADVDAAGQPRQVGPALDLGALERQNDTDLTPISLAINPSAGGAAPAIRTWSTLPGSLTIGGGAATIAALQWQTLVNGVWTALPPGGSLSSSATSTSSTLLVAAPISESIPDQQVRFIVVGTGFASPVYTVTTASNIVYVDSQVVNGGNVTGGDGLSWATALHSVSEALAIAAANPHTEIWLQAGIYQDNVTVGSGVRIYGGFAGTETVRGERSTDRTLTSYGGSLQFTGGDNSAVVDCVTLDLEGAGMEFTQTGALFNNCAIENFQSAIISASNTTQLLDFESCAFDGNVLVPYQISCAGGALKLAGCTMTGSGGLMASGQVTLANSSFTSLFNPQAGGHALNLGGSALTMSGCTVNLGSSGATPVSVTTTGPVVITGCTFNSNESTLSGGGALGVTGASALTLDRCVFSGNLALGTADFSQDDAGALWAVGVPVSIRNSYFSGNSSEGNGDGAIHLTSCASSLVGDTITGNSCEDSGGLVLDQSGPSAPSTATVTNGILWGNTGQGGPSLLTANLASANTTLTLSYSIVQGFNVATAPGLGLLALDPQLVSQGAIFVPGPSSPALNAGETSAVIAGETDVLGQARIVGPGVDLGASEFQGTPAAPAYGVEQTQTVVGGYLTVVASTGGLGDLQWQLFTGGIWTSLPLADIVSDVASGDSRTLEVVWQPSLQGAQIRLAGSEWDSAPVTLDYSTTLGINGHVLLVTPGPGNPAGSARPTISLTLDEALAPGSLTAANLAVSGSLRGRLQAAGGAWGGASTAGLAASVTPGISFAPGESVEVSATSGLQTALGGTFSSYVSRFRIPWNVAPGGLRPAFSFATAGTLTGVAVGDLTGDGVSDVLLVGTGGAWVYQGTGSGGYTNLSLPASGSWDAVAIADFNGDGRNDFIGSQGGSSLTIQTLAAGNAGTTNLLTAPLAFGGTRLLPGDFNGDGRQDVLVLGPSNADGEALLINHGDGTFSAGPQRFATTDRTLDAAVADLDRNGTLDFVQLTGNGKFTVWFNDGTGDFHPGATFSIPGATAFALADFDGDGYPDLLVAGGPSGGNTLQLWHNDGTGNFVLARGWAAGAVQQMVAADFAGNGVVDVLAITGNAPDTLWINDGTGNFTAQTLPETSSGAALSAHAVVADLNGDGSPDVLLPEGAQSLIWTPGIYFAGLAVTVAEHSSIVLPGAGLTGATLSYSGVPLGSYQLESLPTQGALTLSGAAVTQGQNLSLTDIANLTYTPAANYYGSDSFTLAPRDNNGTLWAAGTVALTVSRVFAAPVTPPQSATAYQNIPLNLTVAATDPEAGAVLTYSVATGALNGTVTATGGGGFTYTPASGYTGPDSFTYQVSDGQGNLVTGTVSLTVDGVDLMVTSAAASGPGTLTAALDQALAVGGFWHVVLTSAVANQTLLVGTATDTVHGPTAFLVGPGESIFIDGTGAAGVTIAPASAGATLRLFRVAAGGTLSLTDVALSGWLIGGEAAGIPARGSVVYNEGTLIATGATFSANTAMGSAGAGAEGGAIYCTGTGLFQNPSAVMTFTSTGFTGNTATDNLAIGSGGAVFQRNADGGYHGVSFAANVAATTGADVEVEADGAYAHDTWDAGSATSNLATVRVNGGTLVTYCLGATVSGALPVYISPIADQSESGPSGSFTVTVAGVTDAMSVYLPNLLTLAAPGATSGTAISVQNGSGSSRTVVVTPVNGWSGTEALVMEGNDGGSYFYRSFNLTYANTAQVGPVNVSQTVPAADGNPVSFQVAAVSEDGGPVTFTIAEAPSHGVLNVTSGSSATTLIYTPNAGATGTDFFTYEATGDNGQSTVEGVTVYLTTANQAISEPAGPAGSPSVAGSLLADQGAPAAQTFTLTLPQNFANFTEGVPAAAQNTPAGPAAYVITGHVIIDGTSAPSNEPGYTISGAGSAVPERLFYIAPGATLELRRVNLAGGAAVGSNGSAGWGGAIYNDGGTLIANAVEFSGNSATGDSGQNGLGGAIYNHGGSVALTAASFSGNSAVGGVTATSAGGAVYSLNGSVTIAGGITFSGDSAAAGTDVSLDADAAVLSLNVVSGTLSGLDTAVANGGTLAISAGTNVVTGASLPSFAPVTLPTVAGLASVPITLTGVPATLSVASDTGSVLGAWLSIGGTATAPVLQILPDPSVQTTGTLAVTATTSGYSFERDVAISLSPYSAPTLDSQTLSPLPNAPLAFTLTGTHSPSTTLTYALISPPAHGTISGTAPNLTYTSALNYLGSDSATYQVTDSLGNSGTATIAFQVAAPDQPVVNAATLAYVGENQPYTFEVDGFASDSATATTLALVQGPSHGTLVLNSSSPVSGGSQIATSFYTYTPATGYLGNDTIVYSDTDIYGQTTLFTQTLTTVDLTTDRAPTLSGLPGSVIKVAPGQTVNPFTSATAHVFAALNLNVSVAILAPDPSLGTLQEGTGFWGFDGTNEVAFSTDAPDLTTALQSVSFAADPGYVPGPGSPGIYAMSVTITDDYGLSTTYSVPIQIVIPGTQDPPALTVTQGAGGSRSLAFAGAPSTAYDLFSSTDLAAWTLLTTVTTDAGGAAQYVDSPALSNGLTRFYRAAAH